MKKRITVLLGAGAVTEATGITTKTITDKVFEACKDYKLNSGKAILEKFSEDFRIKHYKALYNRNVNFEDLYDMVEGVADYQSDTNDSASAILSVLRNDYSGFDYIKIYMLKRTIINTINQCVAEYDSKLLSKGNWIKNYFHELIKQKDCSLDVFNLNYDTWIEQILDDEGGYVDGYESIEGYEEFQRFNVQKYLTPANSHTVSHLHGQICFGDPSFKTEDINRYAYEEQEFTLYKYKDYKSAEYYRNMHARSDPKTQSGHTTFAANIITGRMKTDKLLWAPMQMYMCGLMKALMNNEELIIIGYGFGDYYINHMLYQYLQRHRNRKHITMVTLTDSKKHEEELCTYGVLFEGDQARFSQCMMGETRWCEPFHRQDRYNSKDKSAEIYIDGFKKYSEFFIQNNFEI